MTAARWFDDHANIVRLTAFLAERGATGLEVAYAVEKPWKFEHKWRAICAEPAADEVAAMLAGAVERRDRPVSPDLRGRVAERLTELGEVETG